MNDFSCNYNQRQADANVIQRGAIKHSKPPPGRWQTGVQTRRGFICLWMGYASKELLLTHRDGKALVDVVQNQPPRPQPPHLISPTLTFLSSHQPRVKSPVASLYFTLPRCAELLIRLFRSLFANIHAREERGCVRRGVASNRCGRTRLLLITISRFLPVFSAPNTPTSRSLRF